MTERELLDELRSGSTEAFERLFRGFHARLVGLAESMLRDRSTAEEVVQDVMLEVWRRRRTLVVEATLQAYLFRATRNRALNVLRHERVAVQGEPHATAHGRPSPPADERVLEAEIQDALRRALDHLPGRCREVFELSRVHGLRYAEIASVMDISVKTVEAQMGKALRILREQLADWLPGSQAG